ncbi:MAG: hypothetical protein H6812_07370 [Phycisphaeraceae bacterium]|nr:hypothetical protein [Phycisphaerales bacterium]MCB9843062.1 hypothetical protein [Phycisphaeraceae bacterium]
MRWVWKPIRAILRFPLTPPVLAMLLYIDANAIATSLLMTGDSTIADKIASGMASLKERPGSFIPTIEYAVHYHADENANTLYTTRPDHPNPEPWPGDKPHVAQFKNQQGNTYTGLYAPTTRFRVSQVTAVAVLASSPAQLQQSIDLYVDHIIDRTDEYPTQLKDRSLLSRLKSPASVSFSVPRYEERSVSESDIIWSGYLHNTLAATALLALLISAPWSLCTIPGRIRRWRYKGPGRCNTCGYDITGVPDTTTCPECGSPTSCPSPDPAPARSGRSR